MKQKGREAAAFCRAPDADLAGALLHGADESVVAACRRQLIEGLLGADADPLRLHRLDGAVVRRDPTALDSALRARGFFAGRAVVLVEAATDALADPIGGIISDAAPGDAFLIVTAGALAGRSALRKLFEAGKRLISLQVDPEAPDIGDIEARLAGLGMRAGIAEAARPVLASIAAGMGPAVFERFLEVVALSALGNDRPLDAGDVAALAPSGLDAEIDSFVEAVATGRAELVGPILRRITASGAAPVGVILGLQRHFRQLLLAASAAAGVEAGMDRLRPPIWGTRRDAMRAQLRAWRRDRLEAAARLLFETDGRLRSGEAAPALALVERCALRLAMMAGR